jgi:hypothetical protein
LIQRAKAKKNYAKILKEEGMESNRLGVEKEKGKGRERVGLVKDPYAMMKKDGAGSDSDEDEEEEEEKGTEVEIMKAGRKRALSTSPSPPPAPERQTHPAKSTKSKGKEREVPNERSAPTKRPQPEREGPRGRPAPKTEEKVEEKQPSLRGLKKEAFAKRYPPNHTAIRGGLAGRGRGGPVGGGAGGYGRRGQPNMGARMGVLLEAIKRGSKWVVAGLGQDTNDITIFANLFYNQCMHIPIIPNNQHLLEKSSLLAIDQMLTKSSSSSASAYRNKLYLTNEERAFSKWIEKARYRHILHSSSESIHCVSNPPTLTFRTTRRQPQRIQPIEQPRPKFQLDLLISSIQYHVKDAPPAPFPVAASPAAVDGSAEGGVAELDPEPVPAVGAEREAVVLLV